MSRLGSLVLLLLPMVAPAADAVRFDRDGDPLPAGALVRYGSGRLRHPGGAVQLAFSRDGRQLVSVGGEPPCAIVWDIATGKALARLEAKGLACAAMAPNGTVILASNEPACLYWDPINNRTHPLLAALKVKDEARGGRAVAIAPDGSAVALGCDKGLIIWLDIASGREIGRFERRDQPDIQSLTYSNDGKTLVVRAGGIDTFLVDAQRFRATRSYAFGKDYTPEIWSAALSPDGARLAVSIQDRRENNSRLRMLETAFDDEPRGFSAPPLCPRAVQFAPDGAAVLGILDDGTFLRWNATTGHEDLRVVTNEPVGVAAFDAAARYLAVAEPGGFIRIYDAATGKLRSPAQPAHALATASFVDDGRLIATQEIGSAIRLWNRDTGEHRKSFTIPDSCLSPDGRTLAAWDSEHTLFRVIDAATGKERWRSPAVDVGGRMSFSPDGRLLAVGRNRPAALDVWDVASGRRRATLLPSADSDFSELHPIWSPDGHQIMAFDKLREPREIGMLCTFSGRQPTIYEVESILRVWEVTTGQLRWEKKTTAGEQAARPAWSGPGLNATFVQHRIVRSFRVGHDEPVWEELAVADATAIGVSRDGRRLALGFKDGTVHVREPGKPARHVGAGHSGPVTSLTFAADTSRLLSGSTDGTAILWDVASLPPPSAGAAVPTFEAERAWKALAEPKGAELRWALDILTAQPAQALALLGGRLQPIVAPDPKRVEKLIAEIGDSKYDVREKAHRELVAMGEQVESAIIAALQSPPNTEAKRRLESLIATLDGPTADPGIVRQVRAVEVLEHLAGPAARELLAKLATGDPNARLTKEATAALVRLKRN